MIKLPTVQYYMYFCGLTRKWDEDCSDNICGYHHKADSTELREGHVSLMKTNECKSVLKILVCVSGWGVISCMCDWLHSSSPRLSIDLQISLFYIQPSTARCPNASIINSDAEQHKHISALSLLNGCQWRPHSNQPSSPADNALWKPSPWELLHMLWVVVKETWLNNGASSLMHRLASLCLTHLFCAVFLRCENSRAVCLRMR